MPANRSSRNRGKVESNRRRVGSRESEYRSDTPRERAYEGDYEREENGGSSYREESYGERGGRRNMVRRGVSAVGSKVGSMDLDKALVLLHTALALAIVIKQTRSHGRPRKAEPFRSAMSVLNYYLNEGRELSEMQRATLEDIKEELRMLYQREEDEMMSPARG
jgi:hypothetical protein